MLNEKTDEKAGEEAAKTMFHSLRDCNLPPSEKTLQRFCDEGGILLGAGSEMTAKDPEWGELLRSGRNDAIKQRLDELVPLPKDK